MANVQLQNGYIKIANDLFEQLIIRKFSSKQLRILNLLLRCSYGFNTKTAIISPRNRFTNAYIYENKIKADLEYLEDNKVIFCDFENNTFSVNKNYDEWEIPYHALYNEEKFNELKRKNFYSAQEKNFPHREDELPPQGSQENGASPTGKSKLPPQGSQNFPHREDLKADSPVIEEDTDTPKDIKDIKDNIYIIKDIYHDPLMMEFRKSYMEIIQKPFRINKDEREKLKDTLNELATQGFKFKDVVKEFFDNFKKIDFSKINFDPSIHWVLKNNNFLSVLDGEFTNKKKEEWNSDDFYCN